MFLNNLNAPRFLTGRTKAALAGATVLALAMAGVSPITGQRSGVPTAIGIPEDWSHHHVVFAAPRSAAEAVEQQREPRYWHQWFRRNVTRVTESAAARDLAPGGEAALTRWPPISIDESNRRRRGPDGLAGLWFQTLASGATVGPGNYPAKYSFFPINAGSCSADFIALNTSLATGTADTGVTITFNNNATPDNTGTIVITNNAYSPPLVLTMTAGTTWSNASTTGATNAAAFNTALNSGQLGLGFGVYSTISTNVVTIQSTRLGAMNISVAVNNLTTVTGGGSLGLGTNAMRVTAYNNLYTGGAPSCTGPTALWNYETGGVAKTSLTLSADGTQVAFVQTITVASGSTAELVLLKTSSSGSLTVPTFVAPGSYRGCTAPCMTTFPLGADDTNSSPFLDYFGDILYVGDNVGHLHEFTGVFNGTAAAGPAPWPVTLSGAGVLTSPVYDSASKLVFLGDSTGFLWSVTTTGTVGTVVKSAQVASSGGITDAPLVDVVTGKVYVFVAVDMHTPGSTVCHNGAVDACNGVFQFATNFSSATALTEVVLGTAFAGVPIYDGTFDHTFYTNVSPAGTTGELYACNINQSGNPALKQIGVSQFVLGSTSATATNIKNPLTSAAATCSPISEVFTSSTDWIFLSVTANGNVTGGTNNCAGACVYSYNVTTPVPATSVVFGDGIASSGGASGIIIDNSAGGGGSQVYFTFLSNATGSLKCGSAISGGCLVQASQAALH